MHSQIKMTLTPSKPKKVLLPADILAERILNHDHWEGGRRIIRSIFRPHARVAVKGCHASGKTFAAADIALLTLFDGGEVITTAPTDDQVRGVMWKLITEAVEGSRINEWGELLQRQLVTPDGLVAMGRSTNKGVRFQGYHAGEFKYLTIILDEGPGIEASILESIEGIAAAGDVRLLFLGNPTDVGGPFYDAFDEKSLWKRITINAWDTPNLQGVTKEQLLTMDDAELDNNVRPYLVTRRWVKERLIAWGESSPQYMSRVLGEFPDNADTALFPSQWIRGAILRPSQPDVKVGITAGIDVSGPGEDLTVCWMRRGPDLLGDPWESAEPEPYEPCIAHLKRFVQAGLKTVLVDEIGVGYHFFVQVKNALKPLGIQVLGVNVARKPTRRGQHGEEVFWSQKDQHYWNLREKFQLAQINGLTHVETIRQLRSQRYELAKGKVKVADKDAMRELLGCSPDHLEALMLCYAEAGTPRGDPYGVEMPMRVGS